MPRLYRPPTKAVVERWLTRGLARLIEKDSALLRGNVHERTIVAALASHLGTIVGRKWDVDVEYNLDGHDPKRVDLTPCLGKVTPRRALVLPDLIVHRRQTDVNLLVLEVKKAASRTSPARDICKLKAYRRELGYRFGVFLTIANDGTSSLRWFGPRTRGT
jgi:hypothetical protein